MSDPTQPAVQRGGYPDNDPSGSWHLDKKVPISLIFALLLQLSALGYWLSNVSSRVETNARDIAQQRGELTVLRQAAQTQAVQMGRIEEQITGLRTDIGRMIETIERGR